MDINLYYREAGSGETLIMLHGNGESSEYFEHQIEYFSKNYRVLALDTRGHGNSPRGVAPFTIKQFARDLNEFMIEHEIEKAILLGFSDGANIAMEFAIEHEEKVEALILNGGNMNPSGVGEMAQVAVEKAYERAKAAADESEKMKKKMELLGLMVNEPNMTAGELGMIKVPTLVMAGADDVIKEEHTRDIADAIPNARLVFIEGDHFVASQNPEAFNAAVDKFLLEL